MSTDSSKARPELQRVEDAAVESLWETSDQEMLDETRAAGTEPGVEAERVRSVLLGAVRSYRRQALAEAKATHQARLEALGKRQVDLPSTATGRRDLLVAVLSRQPELGAALTVQHRELRSLNDDDIESYLRQLADLGVLDEPKDPGGGA